MTHHKKHDDAERQQFEQALAEARGQLASHAGAGAAAGEGARGVGQTLAKFWGVLSDALVDSHFVDWLYEQFKKKHAPEQPPAPPPEPAS